MRLAAFVKEMHRQRPVIEAQVKFGRLSFTVHAIQPGTLPDN
jgi:hypothetical protein